MALPCFLHHDSARYLVHITDDLNEAVDIALSGLM